MKVGLGEAVSLEEGPDFLAAVDELGGAGSSSGPDLSDAFEGDEFDFGAVLAIGVAGNFYALAWELCDCCCPVRSPGAMVGVV
jgi:hypothetical protein